MTVAQTNSPESNCVAVSPADRRCRLLVENMGSYAVVVLDEAGRIVHWSTGARHVFGWEPQEAIGRTIDFMYPKQDVTEGKPEADMALPIDRHRVETEGLRVRKDGVVFWARVLWTDLWDQEGQTLGMACVMEDITARKHAEFLDRDRRQVLELVARNEPSERVLHRLAELTEQHCPGIRTSIGVLSDGKLSTVAAPQMSRDWLSVLNEHAVRLAADLQASAGERADAVLVSDLRHDPIWTDLRHAALNARIQICWFAPITSSSGDLLGILLAYGDGTRNAQPTAVELESIRLAVQLAGLTLEHQQLTEQLSRQAQHDSLTGLPNRMCFEDRLHQALAQAQRSGGLVGLFLIDLDRFKYVNDTLGHHAGDELLRQVATRWLGSKREADTLARLGGDEFGLILPLLREHDDALRVARRLVEALREPLQIAGHDIFVTGSIGIAVFPQDGVDALTLQRNADVAMYRAKSAGRNGFQTFAPEMNAKALERLALEGQLRRAVEAIEQQTSGHAFELHYQPKVDAQLHLVGLEALLRWNCDGELVPPAKFIPVAEETGLIVPLGMWTLREACRQNYQWQLQGLPPVKVAVNVSAMQFAQSHFTSNVAAVLRQSGLQPCWLELEITETLLMQNTTDAIAKLHELRRMGVSLAVDDFGTGYSSLAYLQRLPIDTLKIDRSFVSDIQPDVLHRPMGPDTAVIRAVASMAQSLGLGVVAEGVQEEHQRIFLQSLGCQGMQGYLFGRPIPASQVAAMLRSVHQTPVARSA